MVPFLLSLGSMKYLSLLLQLFKGLLSISIHVTVCLLKQTRLVRSAISTLISTAKWIALGSAGQSSEGSWGTAAPEPLPSPFRVMFGIAILLVTPFVLKKLWNTIRERWFHGATDNTPLVIGDEVVAIYNTAPDKGTSSQLKLAVTKGQHLRVLDLTPIPKAPSWIRCELLDSAKPNIGLVPLAFVKKHQPPVLPPSPSPVSPLLASKPAQPKV